MTITDIAKEALAALERGDVKLAASHLSDDLVFSGAVPEPMGKKQYLGVMRALLKGLPNWSFNARNWRQAGNTVTVDVRITGTHVEALPPVLPIAPPILATGRHVSLPDERLEFTFAGDSIVRIDIPPVLGGGILGVLKQLGVDLTYAA